MPPAMRDGLGAGAPEGVEAVGALDRAAGVLRDPQAVGLVAVHVEEHRRAQAAQFGIGRDRRRAGSPATPSAPSGPGPVSSRKKT